jgi:hypothetical protein
MAYVLQLQALSAPEAVTRGTCYSHVTSYAGTCSPDLEV